MVMLSTNGSIRYLVMEYFCINARHPALPIPFFNSKNLYINKPGIAMIY